LTKEGRIKLADLGVAFNMNSATEPEPAGSPHWMAPEVASGSRPAPSNDIWALGIMLIELIEGSPPHSSIPPLSVLEVVCNAPSPILRKVPAWGPQLSNLISECLTKDPRKRPSAKDLLGHPFIDSEIMKVLISGAASDAMKKLVQENFSKIVDFRKMEEIAASSDITQAGQSADEPKEDYSDKRDSLVRVEMSLEDKLRQQNMDLIFNLAQRYSLKGGATAILSGGGGGGGESRSKVDRAKRTKSVKIKKLQSQFLPVFKLDALDAQLHGVGERLKKAMVRMTSN